MSVMYISFGRLCMGLTSAGLLCWTFWLPHCPVVALPALWSCASCKGPCAYECDVHQLLLSVKGVDKRQTALLSVLTAQCQVCCTTSSLELRFAHGAMHAW